MKIIATKLDGVYVIEPAVHEDGRGKFVKIFHHDTFLKNGLPIEFAESSYSVSAKNVIRGMHFQAPPRDHGKLIYVTSGAILDVALDVRKGSPTYGEYESVELSGENHRAIYIPSGFAHGFLSLRDNSCLTYMQTTMYSPESEAGIRFDSFGMDWSVSNPIVSDRDQDLPPLEEFETPFVYNNKA